MLSRRIFRELTDRILLGPSYKQTVVPCIAAQCQSCRSCSRLFGTTARFASSSSTRWKSRQGKDFFAREARVQGLKSRAAFKLLEVPDCNLCHSLFADNVSSTININYSSLAKPSLIWYAQPCLVKQMKLKGDRALRQDLGHRYAYNDLVGWTIADPIGRCESYNSERSRHWHRSHSRTTSTRRLHHSRQLFVSRDSR
jgi:hypothetical protein